MKFNKLEEIMSQKGYHSLAEIARALETTPQAVSNWKARNQVPYHIVSRLNSKLQRLESPSLNTQTSYVNPQIANVNNNEVGFVARGKKF